MKNVSIWFQQKPIPQLSMFCLIQVINNYVQINIIQIEIIYMQYEFVSLLIWQVIYFCWQIKNVSLLARGYSGSWYELQSPDFRFEESLILLAHTYDMCRISFNLKKKNNVETTAKLTPPTPIYHNYSIFSNTFLAHQGHVSYCHH